MSDRPAPSALSVSGGPQNPLKAKPLPPPPSSLVPIRMGAILSLIGLAAVLFVLAGFLSALGIPVLAVAHSALHFLGNQLSGTPG